MNLQIGQGVMGWLISVPLAISWSSLAGGWRIHFQDGWQVGGSSAEDGDQDLSSSQRVSLYIRAWACSQHGGWIPRVIIPREKDREVHGIFMMQPPNSHGTPSAICSRSRQSQRLTPFTGKGHRPHHAVREG